MSNDQESFSLDEMPEQFRREIFAYIQKRVSDRAAAEDLTQETFLKVQTSFSKGTEPEHFRGWIFKIARNAVIDFIIEKRRFLALEEAGANSEIETWGAADSIDSEFRQRLFSYASKVIAGLPRDDREALTLTELDGLSRKELASHLGISVTAAKSRVARARTKLRKAVEECCRLVTDSYGRVIDWKTRELPCCEKSIDTKTNLVVATIPVGIHPLNLSPQ